MVRLLRLSSFVRLLHLRHGSCKGPRRHAATRVCLERTYVSTTQRKCVQHARRVCPAHTCAKSRAKGRGDAQYQPAREPRAHANMARIRQSRPDIGLVFQGKALNLHRCSLVAWTNVWHKRRACPTSKPGGGERTCAKGRTKGRGDAQYQPAREPRAHARGDVQTCGTTPSVCPTHRPGVFDTILRPPSVLTPRVCLARTDVSNPKSECIQHARRVCPAHTCAKGRAKGRGDAQLARARTLSSGEYGIHKTVKAR